MCAFAGAVESRGTTATHQRCTGTNEVGEHSLSDRKDIQILDFCNANLKTLTHGITAKYHS